MFTITTVIKLNQIFSILQSDLIVYYNALVPYKQSFFIKTRLFFLNKNEGL